MTNLKFYGGLREKKNSKLRLASKQKSGAQNSNNLLQNQNGQL